MLVVTRTVVIPHLTWVLCAPVTRVARDIPTEIPLLRKHGLKIRSVASFDNLESVRTTALTERIGVLDEPRRKICAALAALADC